MTTKAERIFADAKRYIEQDEERLLNNEFQPSLCFFDDVVEVPRVILLPEITPDSRGAIAWALKLISASIDDLDCITFSVDTYAHKHRVSGSDRDKFITKLDGTEWERGEMEYAWLNDTPDKALLTEAYTYQIAYNDGTFAMLSVPYVKDVQAGTIEFQWDDVVPFITEQDGKPGGFFPEAMFDALTATKFSDLLKQDGRDKVMDALGLEPWRAQLHSLAMALKIVIKETEWPVLIPARSDEEAELIDYSFNEGPMSEGITAYSEDDVNEIVTLEEAFDRPAVGTPEWFDTLPTSVVTTKEDNSD